MTEQSGGEAARDPLAALLREQSIGIVAMIAERDSEAYWTELARRITEHGVTLDATRPSGDEALRLDFARYQRLRILGCAPGQTEHLSNGTVIRFTTLDDFLDHDLALFPTRGEAHPALATPSSAPDVEGHHFDAACEECRLRARGYVDPALRDSRS